MGSANQLDLLVRATDADGWPSHRAPTFSLKISDGEPQRFRSTDPDTSVLAAESMEAHAKHQEAVLLQVFAAYPDGLTAEEAGAIAGFAAWRRVSDLLNANPPKLRESGETRRNASGRKARVLVLAGVP